MYEQFGAIVDQALKTVTFGLFVPDRNLDPNQYDGGGSPNLTGVFVVGGFQDPLTRLWDLSAPVPMTAAPYPAGNPKGTLYRYVSPPLPDGFYEYKYLLRFPTAAERLITDPCGRYGGIENQNSGFVVGGAVETVEPLAGRRRPYSDLIVYELMIDDFTAGLKRADEAPLQTIVRKLDELAALGINAIEFMPWTAWMYPVDAALDFSWGYNPAQYYSVAHKYTLNPGTEVDKLVYLKRLISECHRRNIHVIMDGVFNHADATPPDRGFPYYWLYEEPADSPYVGNFADHSYFQDLDYENQCTFEYIRDACFYWMDKFQIDGIRLDNTLGLYKADDRAHGLPRLLSEIRAHCGDTGNENFALILEHSWDFEAIDVTNKVGATSCWFDPYRSRTMDYLGNRPQGVPQVEPGLLRLLDAHRDFADGHGPTVYIENHDHRRFMLKAGGRGFWYLTQPYIIALFTSPGAVLIYNGQEFGLDNDMPEDGLGRVVPRPLDWLMRNEEPGPTVFARYQQMMRIRNEHPGLRSGNFYPGGWDEGWTLRNEHGFGIDRGENVVVYHRWGDDGQGRLERFYIALNFSQFTRQFSFEVPDDGPWVDLISGHTATVAGGRMWLEIGSNWGAVYYKRY